MQDFYIVSEPKVRKICWLLVFSINSGGIHHSGRRCCEEAAEADSTPRVSSDIYYIVNIEHLVLANFAHNVDLCDLIIICSLVLREGKEWSRFRLTHKDNQGNEMTMHHPMQRE